MWENMVTCMPTFLLYTILGALLLAVVIILALRIQSEKGRRKMMSEPGGIGYDKARVDALEYQVNALEDQVVVDTAIIKAHNVEIKRLRNVLDLYGVHLSSCGIRQNAEELVCTCGLVQPPEYPADSRQGEK